MARAWCMRGTLHLVATEDLGWLLGLLGPIGVAAAARRRAELGLGEDAYARALAATVAALGDLGPAPRAELAAEPREPRRRRLETRLYGAAPEFDIDAHALTPARTPESQSLVTVLGRSSTLPLGLDQVAPSRETHAPAQAAGERLEREIDACEGRLAATHSRLEGLGFLDRVRHGRALCAEQRALPGLRRELAHQRVEGPAPQSAETSNEPER